MEWRRRFFNAEPPAHSRPPVRLGTLRVSGLPKACLAQIDRIQGVELKIKGVAEAEREQFPSLALGSVRNTEPPGPGMPMVWPLAFLRPQQRKPASIGTSSAARP